MVAHSGQRVAADLAAIHGETSVAEYAATVILCAVSVRTVGDDAVILAAAVAVAECERGAVGEFNRVNCRCRGDAVAVQAKLSITCDAESCVEVQVFRQIPVSFGKLIISCRRFAELKR